MKTVGLVGMMTIRIKKPFVKSQPLNGQCEKISGLDNPVGTASAQDDRPRKKGAHTAHQVTPVQGPRRVISPALTFQSPARPVPYHPWGSAA